MQKSFLFQYKFQFNTLSHLIQYETVIKDLMPLTKNFSDHMELFLRKNTKISKKIQTFRKQYLRYRKKNNQKSVVEKKQKKFNKLMIAINESLYEGNYEIQIQPEQLQTKNPLNKIRSCLNQEETAQILKRLDKKFL